MLSVQSRETHRRHDSDSYKRSSQLSPISDTDILFDFNIEEDKPDKIVSFYLRLKSAPLQPRMFAT